MSEKERLEKQIKVVEAQHTLQHAVVESEMQKMRMISTEIELLKIQLDLLPAEK